MRIGDRAEVTARWSSFFKMRGEITQTEPFVMIRLDGDLFPIRVGKGELKALEASEP